MIFQKKPNPKKNTTVNKHCLAQMRFQLHVGYPFLDSSQFSHPNRQSRGKKQTKVNLASAQSHFEVSVKSFVCVPLTGSKMLSSLYPEIEIILCKASVGKGAVMSRCVISIWRPNRNCYRVSSEHMGHSFS